MGPLFADIGNTRVKIAKVIDGSVIPVFSGSQTLLDNEICSRVRLLSNVGMSETQQKSLFGSCPSVHDKMSDMPITLAYKTPKNLGQDRVAAMIGAWVSLQKTGKKGALAVLDVGSCVTIDVLNSEGHHLGGNIDIGLQWRLKATHAYAENLPLLDFDSSRYSPNLFLASNTMDAMGFGIVSGFLRQQLDSVRFCTQRYDVQYIYITGGLAPWIFSFLSKEDWVKNKRQEIFVDEDLVIRGLNDIFAHE